MGTALTGTEIKDTYDSLIKVTDNGPISATAKYLSDGLGNDSALALSTGNIGIGTNTPDSNLVVNGSASMRINLRASDVRYGTVYADNGILALSSITAIPLVLATDDTERMRIDSSGNVGIGTTSPAGNLHIAAASDTGIRIQAGASSLSYIDLADTASGAPSGSIAYNHIVDALTFATGGSNTERMRIDSAGNVGIGTSSPSSAGAGYTGLDVRGISGGSIRYGVSGGINMLTYATGSEVDFITSTAANIRFFNLAATGESMRITSTGNVGIGTSSPVFKLDVNGVARTRTGTDGIDIGNPSGNSYRANLLLRGTNAAGANNVSYIGVNVFNTAGSLDITSDADVIIRNGATERARFLAAGGLTFNGDTAAANALDDYEEGTWTPTFTDTLGNNVTAPSTGNYTKIGRQVTLSLYTAWSNKSAASAGAVVYMSGAPFSMNQAGSGNITYYNNMNLTTVGALNVSNAGVGLCYFPIHDNAVEASFLTFGETTNTSTFYFTFTYFV